MTEKHLRVSRKEYITGKWTGILSNGIKSSGEHGLYIGAVWNDKMDGYVTPPYHALYNDDKFYFGRTSNKVSEAPIYYNGSSGKLNGTWKGTSS
jgi:hypothetical protein